MFVKCLQGIYMSVSFGMVIWSVWWYELVMDIVGYNRIVSFHWLLLYWVFLHIGRIWYGLAYCRFLVCSDMFLYVLVRSGMFWYVLAHSGMFWYVLIRSGMLWCFMQYFWYILVRSGIFQYIVIHSDMFWHLPIYFGTF